MMTLRHENVFLITGPFVRGITGHHCFPAIKDQWCRDCILLCCHPDLAVEQTAELLMITDDMVRIMRSAAEDNLSPFDSNIACLCHSIEINNNKHVCMFDMLQVSLKLGYTYQLLRLVSFAWQIGPFWQETLNISVDAYWILCVCLWLIIAGCRGWLQLGARSSGQPRHHAWVGATCAFLHDQPWLLVPNPGQFPFCHDHLGRNNWNMQFVLHLKQKYSPIDQCYQLQVIVILAWILRHAWVLTSQC